MNLQQFLQHLDDCTSSFSLDHLKSLLDRLSIDDSELEKHCHFGDDRYQRNLLRRNNNYETLFLCFEAGQRTPIHDHAGSACGVKIIEGTGIETIFESTSDGWPIATCSQELPQGGVVGSQEMDIHQLSNLQSEGQRMVTLHIYAPPLGEVGNYSIEDNSVKQVKATTRDATCIA